MTVWAFALPGGGWEFHVPVCTTSGLVLSFDLSDTRGKHISGRSTYVEGLPARVVVLTVNDLTLADNSFNVDEVSVGPDDRSKESPQLEGLDVIITTSDSAAEFNPGDLDPSLVAVYHGRDRDPVRTFARDEADDQDLLTKFCGSLG